MPASRPSRSTLLWFGLLGGPTAWMVQLLVDYSLEEWFACAPATSTRGQILGIGVRPLAIGVTAVLLAITVAAGMAALRCLRASASEEDPPARRARWMALGGIMNSILYFILIVVSFAPPLLLDVCRTSP